MDTNASSGRFYAFTTNTSATLPSTESSPDPQYRRNSSGSESVSDDDGSASQRSHHSERAPPGYGGPRAPYGAQNPPPFVQHRAQSTTATVYVDDSPYDPPSSSRATQAINYVETAPDVLYNPSIAHYNPGIPSSMPSTTLPPTPFRSNSGDSSPTRSNGSGGSDHGSGHSGSSQESASNGVVSTGSSAHDAFFQGHDVFPNHPRVPLSNNFNPVHYPAYDANLRRVGMEHARFGTDPPHPENAYYRPRTHTYPVGAPQMSMGMPASDPMQMHTFPHSTELISMHGDVAFDRNMRSGQVVPGQTRILLPPSSPPHSHSYHPYAYNEASSSSLRVGDDVCIPTSDDDVRRILGLSPDQELSLYALADPPDGGRPGQSIPTLSQLAILGSPNQRLTLQGIYRALEERFVWFRNNKHDKSWQNSIRHNLSLYKCFKRVAKPITEPGKGNYWIVDYSTGAGTKRPRKRKHRLTKAERLAKEAELAASGQAPQENVDEGDSSPEGLDEDEEGSEDVELSPPLSFQDIPIDPALQGHRVGQPHSRNTRSTARSIARRSNSPYSQGQQAPTPSRRQNVPAPMTNIAPPGSRQPSATFGQPSFGQPSLAPSAGALFGQPSMGVRTGSGNRQPGVGVNQQGGGPGNGMFLPPPQPRPIGGAGGHASGHARGNAMPLQGGMGGVGPYAPLPGINELRDHSGRFLNRLVPVNQGGGMATGQQQQQFVQGSSRSGGRRTSSSSNDSSRSQS